MHFSVEYPLMRYRTMVRVVAVQDTAQRKPICTAVCGEIFIVPPVLDYSTIAVVQRFDDDVSIAANGGTNAGAGAAGGGVRRGLPDDAFVNEISLPEPTCDSSATSRRNSRDFDVHTMSNRVDSAISDLLVGGTAVQNLVRMPRRRSESSSHQTTSTTTGATAGNENAAMGVAMAGVLQTNHPNIAASPSRVMRNSNASAVPNKTPHARPMHTSICVNAELISKGPAAALYDR